MSVLTLVILASVLIPKAYTLQCYECTPTLGSTGPCTQTKQCPSSNRCGALKVASYAGGSKVLTIDMKSCAPVEQCVSGSLNFGILKTTLTTKCCSTDLCNTEFPPEPPKPHPNGKKCFSCAVNDPQCTTALNCEGDEDRCVSATMTIGSQKVDMKGCASKSICTGAQTAQIPGMSASVSCCEGDFCNSSNSASSITVNLLLLLLPLLSSVLF